MRTIILFVMMTLVALPLQAKEPTDASVRKLLEVTGSAKMGEAMLQQILPNLKQMAPDAPKEFWDGFMKEFNADDMIKRLIPIYKKQLTESDVQAIIKFYQSPAGKNLVKALPQITQQSMMAGQKWGQEIAQKVMAKYQKEYAGKKK